MLIDPDKWNQEHLDCLDESPDFFFLGGSYVSQDLFTEICWALKAKFDTPIILFPADPSHLTEHADAVLMLSLVSGRNPEFLIGKHVVAAPYLKRSGLEILPTGYLLIDSGQATSASYMSGTMGIPVNKPDIAACTAMAAEMLGLKYIYMDMGSGSDRTIRTEMISAVRESVNIPIIIGGGVKAPEQLAPLYKAGASTVVVGNALEDDPTLLSEFIAAKKEMNV